MREKLTLVEVEREKCRRSLYEFVKRAWHLVEPGTAFQDNWHIKLICDHLEALQERRIRRLIINVPPGCMKSMLVGVFFPVWCWIREPGFRTMGASHDASLTARDAGKSLEIIRSQWFQARWGDRFKLSGQAPVTQYKNNHQGLRFSTSIGGAAVGWHADLLATDDPIKPKGVSKVSLDGCVNWWGGTWASRQKTPTTTVKVIVMQRLHENDLCGHVLANEKEEGWVHLRLPMRYEANNPCVTPIGKDPRTKDGELLWQERYPEQTVRSLEKILGPINAAAQLQQRPVPEGGAIFRPEWFQYHDGKIQEWDELTQSWDCTFKDESTSDWVVGQVWARKGSFYYLLDQYREQASFTDTLKAVRQMAKKWPSCRVILIEDKANGTAVINSLVKGLSESGEPEAQMSNVVAIEPDGGKVARANAVTGTFEAMCIFHPSPEICDWIGIHQRELLTFPMGANDDTVDACTQAINYMRQNENYLEAARQKLFSEGSLTR